MLVANQRAAGHDVEVLAPAGDGSAGARAVTRRRPDVVHAHLSVYSPFTVRAVADAARRGVPVVVTVHSMWPSQPVVMRALLAALGGVPGRVTWSAVSRVAAARVHAVRPDAGAVHVVPNGVDTAWWARPDEGPGAAAGGPTHAVMVNRLATRKRVLPFVGAFARWAPAGMRLTVVGDGPQRARLAALVRRHDLADRVVLTGDLAPAAIRDLLHTADVFLAPATQESFGIAALEARSAGVPVLARRGTGVADVIRSGQDGLLVGSDAEMLFALHRTVHDPSELRSWQRVARATPPTADVARSVGAAERLYALAGARVDPAPPVVARAAEQRATPGAADGAPGRRASEVAAP